jgi:hypothetical protein
MSTFLAERARYSSDNSKLDRAAALTEWRLLCAAQVPAFLAN